MGDPFHIYDPFEISKPEITKPGNKQYPKEFWDERDNSYPKLSEAHPIRNYRRLRVSMCFRCAMEGILRRNMSV